MMSVSVDACDYVKQDFRARLDSRASQAQAPKVRPVSLDFSARKEQLERQVNCLC